MIMKLFSGFAMCGLFAVKVALAATTVPTAIVIGNEDYGKRPDKPGYPNGSRIEYGRAWQAAINDGD